jgi:F-type H+-transporting ATPase subunit epsilon
MAMRLRILLPTQVLLDEKVSKIIAEAHNGSFGILPRHIDFVAALVPGIVAYYPEGGAEAFVGIDEGILVKRGQNVMVSTGRAVAGEELASLRQVVEEKFLELDEHERMARSALARLEAGVVRRFIDLEH